LSDDQEDSKEWGILVHDVMSKIYDREDAEEVLDNIFLKNDLSKEKQKQLFEVVFNILNYPSLNEFFTNKNKVYNEREFVYNNEVLRPDLLTIRLEMKVKKIQFKLKNMLKFLKIWDI